MSKEAKKEPQNEHVKVVMRRLPKRMTEPELLEQISPLPKEVVHYYFVPADLSFDQFAFSTMYLIFSSYCDALFEFEKRFDGYIFVDSKGNDSAAVVEAALNQEYFERYSADMKSDSKCGLVEKDDYYLQFLKKLEEEEATPILTLEQQIRRLGRSDDAKTQIDRLETPLVKHMFDQEYAKRKFEIEARTRREERYRSLAAAKPARKDRNLNNALKEMDAIVNRVPSSPRRRSPRRDVGSAKHKEPPKSQELRRAAREIEGRKKERDAARLREFKKKKEAAKRLEEEMGPEKQKPPVSASGRERRERGQKNGEGGGGGRQHSRLIRPNREGTITLGEQVGKDWIKKLTDPNAVIRKNNHEIGI